MRGHLNYNYRQENINSVLIIHLLSHFNPQLAHESALG